MQPLPIVTEAVHPDERCHLLSEINENIPGQGWRRMQSTYVVRDGRVHVYRVDLGPADAFEKEQFRIVSLGEDSVGYVQDMAERDRLADDYWQKFLAEQAAESTFKEDTLRAFQEAAEVARNRSTFGPLMRKQRNAFISREKVR